MIDPIERLSYSMTMDAERRRSADTHNPWPRGRAIQTVRNFTEQHADPGWIICAHRGLLFVQDAPEDGSEPRVWLGNDSLHFLDHVLASLPEHLGSALEIGSGSGLVSSAIAQRGGKVRAVDVLAEAIEATERSAALNGVSDGVRAELLDGRDLRKADARYDLIVANLPGVPVPEGMGYSVAGAGGPTGLDLITSVIRSVPYLLMPNGRVIMRFQSLGSGDSLLCDGLLEDVCQSNGLDCVVACDQRIPASVRASLTAYYAAPYNPDNSQKELVCAVSANHKRLGCDTYSANSLVMTMGGVGRYVRTAVPTSTGTDGVLWDLPDEFFEMGGGALLPELTAPQGRSRDEEPAAALRRALATLRMAHVDDALALACLDIMAGRLEEVRHAARV